MVRRAAPPIAVAVLTAVCFLPVLSGSFLNWDDDVNFLQNRAYRGLGPEQIRWAFTSVLFGHYIPLTRLTFSLNFVLGGMDPWGYHLLNVLLHAANAVLFYVVARRLLAAASDGGSQVRRADLDVSASAAVAALVFGVHPLRVEPVAWITGRADLLCTAFVLLATWAYLRAVEGPGAARHGLTLVSAAALAAALLSKGVALSIPAAFVLLDVYPLRRLTRLGWRPLVTEKIPLFVVTLAATMMVVYAVRHGTILTPSAQYGVVARVTLAAYSFVISIPRFLWPFALSPLNEMPARVIPLEPRFALAVVAAVLVTVVLVALRRRWPAGLAAWTFLALVLGPTSAAVKVTTDLAPDRHSYLAGLGFAALVGGAALTVIRLVKRGTLARPVAWVAAVAGVMVIAGLGVTSWSYSEIWRHPEILWRWALEVDPACAVCHSNLGQILLADPGNESRAAEAETLFRRAIALRPDLREANFNLGAALMIQGRYSEAEAPLRRAMEEAPSAIIVHERLGRLYLFQRRYAEAIPLLRNVLKRAPGVATTRNYLVEALQGRARELQANGRGAEAELLLNESRALEGQIVRQP
jgi:hypothetical protein